MLKFFKLKKSLSLIAASLMVCSVFPAVSAKAYAQTTTAAPENGQVNLQILETSDTHGRFLPYDYAINAPDTSGSLAQISTAVKELRQKNPNTILLDAGDIIQDNSADLFLNDDKNPMITAMNDIGYDALTFGNHEFNYGIPTLKKNIIDQFKGKVLCGNVYNPDGSRLAAPYTVIEKGGVKVGIIGMVTPNITRWDAANLKDYKVTNPIDETNAAIAELKKQNVDLIVASDHVGETPEYNEPGSGANQILDKCPGIDVFVAAHFHVTIAGDYFYNHIVYSLNPSTKVVTATALDGTTSTATMDDYNKAKANGTVIVEANHAAKTIAQVNVKLTKNSDGKYVIADKAADITSAAYNMSNKSGVIYQPDQALVSELQPYSQRAIDDANVQIGTLKGGDLAPKDEISGITQSMIEPSPMIDLINKVQMYYGGKIANHPIDVSSAADFKDDANMKEGTIKKCDVANIYKFDNTLYVLKITGSELKKYMEWSASYYNTYKPGDLTVSFNKSIPGYNYDMFSGIKYNIDISKDPGSRIVNLTKMDGTPIKDDDVLYMTANNYRSSTQLTTPGTIFQKGEPMPEIVAKSSDLSSGLGDGRIRDLLVKYIKEVKGGTITPEVDNNWSIIGNNWDANERALAVKYINNSTISLDGISGEQTSSNSKSVTWDDVQKAMSSNGNTNINVSNGTVLIGNTAYDIEYANKNQDEISKAISSSNGKVYVKDFSGTWIDNNTGKTVDTNVISIKNYIH